MQRDANNWTMQYRTGWHTQFFPLWKSYMSNSLILVTDVGDSCWMVLNQRSEMLWLTWLDRAWSEVHISELPGVASSEAKKCGEKSYWVVASFEVSTGQNRCKSSTSCHFQISIFFDSCVMCGLPILSPEVCAFSVNQHACICDNVGKAPHEGTPEFQARSCTGTLETTRFSC